MSAQQVIIILNRDATVSCVPDPVHVSKRGHEEITWRCPQGSAVVQFKGPNGSPFESETFVVPQGGSVSSGPTRADAPVGTYTYSVVGEIPDDRRQYAADPKVDVDE
jgi:hypothetical protein